MSNRYIMYDGKVAILDEFTYEEFIQLAIVACESLKPSTMEASFHHLMVPIESEVLTQYPYLCSVMEYCERNAHWMDNCVMFCSRLYQFAPKDQLSEIRARQRWCFKDGLMDEDVYEVAPAQDLEWDDDDVQFIRYIPPK
jgi:hypothetical protein